MKRVATSTWLALLPLAWALSTASATQTLEMPSGSRLERLHVARPTSEPAGFAFLLSDAEGWNTQMDHSADALADVGYAVAGIDLKNWMAALAADPGDTECHYIVGDLEDAGKFVQRNWGLQHYRHPVVAGIGEGATAALLALANAPPATIGGVVALDAAATVHTDISLCPPGAGIPTGNGTFRYPPPDNLPGWVVEARWRRAEPAFRLSAGLPHATYLDLHESPDPATALVAALDAGRALAPDPDRDAPLPDLPLVEIPIDKPSHTFAIVLSGDGGWRDLDKSLAKVFAERGIPTVGLDSLRYFWTERKPATIARDLDRIVLDYRRRWGSERVALVGYSFGADVLPAAWPLLSEETRRTVVQVSLLALGMTADFEFHVTGWIGWKTDKARPIPPDLARMDRSRVQCFFGADEGLDETSCRSPEAAGVEQVERPGGHHFDGDYAAIADAILEGVRRRGGGTW